MGYATTNDLASEFLCAFFLPLDPLIVEDQRVQVAVTRVEDVGDAEAVLGAKFFNLAQYLRERCAWYYAILDDVVRTDAAHCCKCGLAALPHQQALLICAGQAILYGPGAAADIFDPCEQRGNLGAVPIQLNQQDGSHVQWVPAVNRLFACLYSRLIHHLNRCWYDTGGDDARYCLSSGFNRLEGGHCGLHAFGLAQDAQCDFGGDAKGAL